MTAMRVALSRDWRHHAACRDTDTELFFPVGTTAATAAKTEDAKAICARCPVRLDCLRFALHTGEAEGVWGGMDPKERKRLRRRARKEAS